MIRPVAVGLTILFAAIGVVLFAVGLTGVWGGLLGNDIVHYLAATSRWLDTGTPYLAREVAAPFADYSRDTFLHPPIALVLFAPFLVLPIVLWWTPLAVVGWCIWSWRPAVWSWPLIAAGLALPRFHAAVFVGNTDLWVWAAVAVGLRLGWPALLIVVKPSLIPLVAAGTRHRSTWLGLPLIAILCLPFGSLWIDWIHVVINAPGGLLYSVSALPWLLVPVLAWAASTNRRVPAIEPVGLEKPGEDTSEDDERAA